jgi:thiol-disulfide isomerase/thioredoxin
MSCLRNRNKQNLGNVLIVSQKPIPYKLNMKLKITKNTILLFIISICIEACQPTADIAGKINGSFSIGGKLYLIEPENLYDVSASYFGNVIDSAAIHEDGSFEFHNLTKSNIPIVLELALQSPGTLPNYLNTNNPLLSNFMPIVWETGKPMQIAANKDDFQKSFSIYKPTDQNKALLELRNINQQAYLEFIAGKAWDGDEKLLDKEQAIKQYQTQLMGFANTTPYLLPALIALRWVSPVNDYERVPEFLVKQAKKWKKNRPEHPWVKQLCKQSAPSNLPILTGDEFPNIHFPLISKDTLALKDILGENLTIIDLWASWCAPCRKENQAILVPLWDQYKDMGLQILAYGLESDETTWKNAIEVDGTQEWKQASDLQGDDTPIMNKLKIRTIPSNFILDANGIVLAKNIHQNALAQWVKDYFDNL